MQVQFRIRVHYRRRDQRGPRNGTGHLTLISLEPKYSHMYQLRENVFFY